MLNLKLLTSLQVSDTVTLILREKSGSRLNYFIISQTVGYAVVCAGECAGTVEGGTVTLNIRMSSIAAFVDKGYKFLIEYHENKLKFVTEDRKISVTPLYVEFRDENAQEVITRYLQFRDDLQDFVKATAQKEQIQEEAKHARNYVKQLSEMNLQWPPSQNPFPTDDMRREQELEKAQAELDAKMKLLGSVESVFNTISELDLSEFSSIALSCSRAHEILNFCGDYAMFGWHNIYFLTKSQCPVMAVPGKVLHSLIRVNGGKDFYSVRGQVVFHTGEGDTTTVFLTKYLPNSPVTFDIVARGKTQERYSVDLKHVLETASLAHSKFPAMQFDMGEAKLILTNDSGEEMDISFDVKEAKTVQLEKLLQGDRGQGEFKMATIQIPDAAQSLLSAFRGESMIYVKSNKIIFNRGKDYLVFGR